MEASGQFHTLVALTRERSWRNPVKLLGGLHSRFARFVKEESLVLNQESGVLMEGIVGLFGLHRCLGRTGQMVKQSNCEAGGRFATHKISHHCWSPNVDCLEEYCFCDLTARTLVAISRLCGVLAQKTVCLHNHQHENLIL